MPDKGAVVQQPRGAEDRRPVVVHHDIGFSPTRTAAGELVITAAADGHAVLVVGVGVVTVYAQDHESTGVGVCPVKEVHLRHECILAASMGS